jgi:DNA repair ATPase RecN
MLPPGRARSPEDFPRVDGQTQRGRDETRRRILQDELNSEEQALAEARQKLTELEGENRGYAVVQGKTVFNEARNNEYLQNLKEQHEQVDSHLKNIEALKTELSKLP